MQSIKRNAETLGVGGAFSHDPKDLPSITVDDQVQAIRKMLGKVWDGKEKLFSVVAEVESSIRVRRIV